MNDKISYQEGDIDSKEKNESHHKKHHKSTSGTSLKQEEDLELGNTLRHGRHHTQKHIKEQSKQHRDEGKSNFKNDADYDDLLIAETTPGATHALASSNRNESLKNKGKRVLHYNLIHGEYLTIICCIKLTCRWQKG